MTEACRKCGALMRGMELKKRRFRAMLKAAYPECDGWCDRCVGHHIVDKTFGGQLPSEAETRRILREARK